MCVWWGRCPCSLFTRGVLLSRALVAERFAERDFVVRITSWSGRWWWEREFSPVSRVAIAPLLLLRYGFRTASNCGDCY